MTYKIKEQVDVSLGKTIGLPGGDIAEKATRIMVRIGDQGMLTDKLGEDSGRDNTDMAKSFSRYNIFSWSSNALAHSRLKVSVVLPQTGFFLESIRAVCDISC